MIEITDKAVEQLKELLAARSAEPGLGLRLRVERGGCAGMQYEMKIDQEKEGDGVNETAGVRVMIDPERVRCLDGSVIDYEDSLNDAGFKVKNPNAARSCGCGTSFEPAKNGASQ